MNFTLKGKGKKAKEVKENRNITADVRIQYGEIASATQVPVTAIVANDTETIMQNI